MADKTKISTTTIIPEYRECTIMIAHPPLALASVTHKGMLSGADRESFVFILAILDEQRWSRNH